MLNKKVENSMKNQGLQSMKQHWLKINEKHKEQLLSTRIIGICLKRAFSQRVRKAFEQIYESELQTVKVYNYHRKKHITSKDYKYKQSNDDSMNSCTERSIKSQSLQIKTTKTVSKPRVIKKSKYAQQNVIEFQEYEEELEEHKNGLKQVGHHRPSQLSLSYIVAKTQEEQQEHQTLDDEEDRALFQKLFERYHQEMIEKQGSQSTNQMYNHFRSQSNSTNEAGILSPSGNSNYQREYQEEVDVKSPANKVFEYQGLQSSGQPKRIHHTKRLSSLGGYQIPFSLTDGRSQSINISQIELQPTEDQFIDEQDTQRLDNIIAQEIQSHLTQNDQDKKDFSFSIDQERGIVHMNQMVPSKTSTRKHSIILSRNNYNEPGLMLLSSKQQREMAALNELNDILNEKINMGVSQRDVGRIEENGGYYETLGSHRIALGYNQQLEQETANFNRDDWIGTQFRSISSRNHVRAETKNSVNSRLSTLQQVNLDQRSTPFLGHHILETVEQEDILAQKSLASPPKAQYDHQTIQNLQEYYKGRNDSDYIQDNDQQSDNTSPLALMHHSHYANFSQDFISPDNLSKKSGISIGANQQITPSRDRKSQLDISGATTPAQQSAFEMFRNRLQANLLNLRSQSQSRAQDSIDQNNDHYPNSSSLFYKKHQSRSHSQSISISEPEYSKRISLNYPMRQFELKRIQQSPIKINDGSREYFNSVYNQIHGMAADDAEENTENNNTMRYVEPFTQRASLANLELAEPMEMGAQSSVNDTLLSNLDEHTQDRQSPLKKSNNNSPSKRSDNVKEELRTLSTSGQVQYKSVTRLNDGIESNIATIEFQVTRNQILKSSQTGRSPSDLARNIENSRNKDSFVEVLNQRHSNTGNTREVSRNHKFAEAFKLYDQSKTDQMHIIPTQSITLFATEKEMIVPKKTLSLGNAFATLDSLQGQTKHLKFPSMFGTFSKTHHNLKSIDKSPASLSNELQSSSQTRKRKDTGGRGQSDASSTIHRGSVTFGQHHLSSFNSTVERHGHTISSAAQDMIHEQSEDHSGSFISQTISVKPPRVKQQFKAPPLRSPKHAMYLQQSSLDERLKKVINHPSQSRATLDSAKRNISDKNSIQLSGATTKRHSGPTLKRDLASSLSKLRGPEELKQEPPVMGRPISPLASSNLGNNHRSDSKNQAKSISLFDMTRKPKTNQTEANLKGSTRHERVSSIKATQSKRSKDSSAPRSRQLMINNK